MLVRERPYRSAPAFAVPGREARPPKAGDLAGVEQHAATERDDEAHAQLMSLLAECQHLLLQLGQVAVLLAGRGFAQHDLVPVPAGVAQLVRPDLPALELG